MAHQNLTDEGLKTLLVKIEAILTWLQWTLVTMDPEANVPLTPNHLLLLREWFVFK